jgi:hypothetical protein
VLRPEGEVTGASGSGAPASAGLSPLALADGKLLFRINEILYCYDRKKR